MMNGLATLGYKSFNYLTLNARNDWSSTKTTIPTFSVANGKVVPNGTEAPVSKTPNKIVGYHKTGYLEDIP